MSSASMAALKRNVCRLGAQLSIAEAKLHRASNSYQRAKACHDEAVAKLEAALVQQAIDKSENVLHLNADRNLITKGWGDADQA